MQRKVQKTTPSPGSPEAVAQNCSCGILDNNHGRGSDWGPGTFVINGNCPLHGNLIASASCPPVSTLKPGQRPKQPAKERIIRRVLRSMEYPELAMDFDALTMHGILAAARTNSWGYNLASLVVMELNDIMSEKGSTNKLCDQAYEALDKAEWGLIKAKSAIELMQTEMESRK